MHASEDDSEVIRVSHASIAEFMDERKSLRSEAEHAKAERDTLAAKTGRLKVAALIGDEDVDLVVRNVLSLVCPIFGDGDWANREESQAGEMLNRI